MSLALDELIKKKNKVYLWIAEGLNKDRIMRKER